jgi:hypothetical protein
MKHRPRRDGRIVELANFPTRLEADAAIGLLEGNGIRAMAKYGDADGWAPHFALLDGFRVCVFDDDLEPARALLEADARLPLPDASDN